MGHHFLFNLKKIAQIWEDSSPSWKGNHENDAALFTGIPKAVLHASRNPDSMYRFWHLISNLFCDIRRSAFDREVRLGGGFSEMQYRLRGLNRLAGHWCRKAWDHDHRKEAH